MSQGCVRKNVREDKGIDGSVVGDFVSAAFCRKHFYLFSFKKT